MFQNDNPPELDIYNGRLSYSSDPGLFGVCVYVFIAASWAASLLVSIVTVAGVAICSRPFIYSRSVSLWEGRHVMVLWSRGF